MATVNCLVVNIFQNSLICAQKKYKTHRFGTTWWQLFYFGVNYPFNYWIQVVQSDLSPQVYKIKHLIMQSAFTYICEKYCYSEELSEFRHGIVTWCHLCNKSVCEISSLLVLILVGIFYLVLVFIFILRRKCLIVFYSFESFIVLVNFLLTKRHCIFVNF